jgi:hypothetical protein
MAPVRRAITAAAGPQAVAAAPAGVDHSPDVRPAPVAGAMLDARVLVITAEGTDPALDAIAGALARLGTPFDVLDAGAAGRPPLTADQLATGSHGRYYAVILDRGTLVLSSGASAFTDDEWNVLTSYEAAFGVRRLVLYGVPDQGYGFSGDPTGVDTSTTPLAAHCTAAGAALLATTNCDNPVSISNAFVYEAAAPLDDQTVPLLIDDAGHPLAVTRQYANGREALVLTFAQAARLDHTAQLVYELIRWVSRGVFLGERHAYFGPQIDDLFLASDIYDMLEPDVRITDTDLQTFHDWQAQQRANPVAAGLRFAFAVNTVRTTGAADAPLALKAQALASDFAWINHTYDHTEMDQMSEADAYDEITVNTTRMRGLGLQPFSPQNLVTPSITGLDNPMVMAAAYAAGVRYLVSDASVMGYDMVPFNEGQLNPSQPGILMIPRRPTNIYYNVSTPDEEVAEYNALNASYWMRNLAYDEILDVESDSLVGYLLDWETDPWMFHQADCRDYGGGHSLLSDLMDRTLAKYGALVKLPVVSPTMDDIGQRVANRMRYDVAQASATIGPGRTLALHVSQAARVPVTGVCTTGAEQYAGQWISYVDVGPDADVTLSLDGCAGGAGGGASDGGAGGAGGESAPDGGMPADSGSGGGGSGGSDGVDGGSAGGSGGSDGVDGGAVADDASAPEQPRPAPTPVGVGDNTRRALGPATSPSAGCACTAVDAGLPSSAPLAISFLLALLIAMRRRSSSL